MIRLGYVALALCLLWTAGCKDPAAPPMADLPQPDLSLVTEERLLEALRTGREEVARSPDSARAWGRLGNLYLIHGWDAEASAYYRRAIELDPGDFRWRYFLGRSLSDSVPQAASEALAEAISLDPDYAPAHHARARALRDVGRNEEAEGHLLEALRLDPGDALALLSLGEIALQAGDFDLARERLERALALQADLNEAHRALAQVYLAEGNAEEARRQAEAGSGPSPERWPPDALWEEVENAGATKYWVARRANRYLAEKKYERAVVEFWKIAENTERNPMFWYNFGNALSNTGRHESAVEMYQRALTALADPFYSETVGPEKEEGIYNNLCLAHARGGDNAAAEQCLRRALERFPASEELTYNLAVLYQRSGRRQEAIRLLEQSQATPASALLQQALDRLRMESYGGPSGA